MLVGSIKHGRQAGIFGPLHIAVLVVLIKQRHNEHTIKTVFIYS